MNPISIAYEAPGRGEKNELATSVREVRERLRSLNDAFSPVVKMPFGVDLVAINGDRLSVALGPATGFLMHYSAVSDEYTQALGDDNAVGWFTFYNCDHTSVPNKFVLPVDLAWQLIEEWLERRTLSSAVKWTSQIR